jgi:hypothetical protein
MPNTQLLFAYASASPKPVHNFKLLPLLLPLLPLLLQSSV